MDPSVLPPFLPGGLKSFHCRQKKGTYTFWIFRGDWVKMGGGGGRFFQGEEGPDYFLKVIFNCLWNMLYLLMFFKCPQLVNANHFMNKKHSSVSANKDKIIRKTSWKFHVHYVKTTFNFWSEFSFRKGKVSCYWIIIFLSRVIKMKYYCFTAVFFFWKIRN